MPKCIVHGAGGTLLQHLKEHRAPRRHAAGRPPLLLHDLRLDDVELAGVGAGVGRDARPLRRLAVSSDARRAVRPRRGGARHASSARPRSSSTPPPRRAVAATDATTSARCARCSRPARPSLPEGFDYVYRESRRTCTWRRSRAAPTSSRASCSAIRPRRSTAARSSAPAWAWRSRCSTRTAGAVSGEPGELVCTRPFPSMPLGFWGDPDGARYRAAYFERFPGVWHHGDYVETERGGFVIHGRSDATSIRAACASAPPRSTGRSSARRGGGVDRRRPGVGRRRAGRPVRQAARGLVLDAELERGSSG